MLETVVIVERRGAVVLRPHSQAKLLIKILMSKNTTNLASPILLMYNEKCGLIILRGYRQFVLRRIMKSGIVFLRSFGNLN